MAKLLGGVISSNKLVTSKAWKTEPKSKAIDPASVSTIGVSTQFKEPNLEMGPGFRGSQMQPTGMKGTYNAKTSGPGSLRTTYPSGAQSQYGSPAPNAVNRAPDPSATGSRGKDIISGFGPERGR